MPSISFLLKDYTAMPSSDRKRQGQYRVTRTRKLNQQLPGDTRNGCAVFVSSLIHVFLSCFTTRRYFKALSRRIADTV